VELPLHRRQRFETEYALSYEQADILCEERALADYFEAAVIAANTLPKQDASSRVANWLLTDVKHILQRENIPLSGIAAFKLTPSRLASLVVMTATGRVSTKNAKQAMETSIAEDRDPEVIIKEKDLEQLTDPEKIAESVRAVHAEEAATFAEIRSAAQAGNAKRQRSLTAYLVGKVLAKTGGRAEPRIVGEQVEALIKG
jgi:aspartyl-tRNA(Asn)/glutamyl-tRNA(Gln) amidotransferase subunit B